MDIPDDLADGLRTVFLVTSGEYSDYRISSIWTTREDAEREVGKSRHSDHDGLRVEEWILNEGPKRSLIQWTAYIEPQTGIIRVQDGPDEVQEIERASVRRPYYGGWAGKGYGPTPEHARKSLSDALAKAKAEEAGL